MSSLFYSTSLEIFLLRLSFRLRCLFRVHLISGTSVVVEETHIDIPGVYRALCIRIDMSKDSPDQLMTSMTYEGSL